MTAKTDVSIVVAGNEYVAGHGDGRGLGWVGRVAARTLPALPRARFYQLAVPHESTASLHTRCITEAKLRFTEHTEKRLVVALGSADLDSHISVARSRLNVANVLDAALSNEVATFVVGPPPESDPDRNRRLSELNAGFADVALRRGIEYVDTFAPLTSHPVWQRELAASSSGLPAQEGYGLLAWLVLHRGWFDWLGVQDVLG